MRRLRREERARRAAEKKQRDAAARERNQAKAPAEWEHDAVLRRLDVVCERYLPDLPGTDSQRGRRPTGVGVHRAKLAVIGVPAATVRSWFGGHRSRVKWSDLVHIATKARVSVDWLAFGIGPEIEGTPAPLPVVAELLRRHVVAEVERHVARVLHPKAAAVVEDVVPHGGELLDRLADDYTAIATRAATDTARAAGNATLRAANAALRARLWRFEREQFERELDAAADVLDDRDRTTLANLADESQLRELRALVAEKRATRSL